MDNEKTEQPEQTQKGAAGSSFMCSDSYVATLKNDIINILKQSETLDIDPPYRVMPAGYSNEWYEFKAHRIINSGQIKTLFDRINELEKGIRDAMMHLETNYSIDGDLMSESDAYDCLKEAIIIV